MSDESPTLAALVREQLQHLVDAVSARMTFDDWYSDGAEFSALIGEPGDADPVQAEACSFAWGYLRGVAEARDQTVMEMLDDLAADEGATRKIPAGHTSIRVLISYRDAPAKKRKRATVRATR